MDLSFFSEISVVIDFTCYESTACVTSVTLDTWVDIDLATSPYFYLIPLAFIILTCCFLVLFLCILFLPVGVRNEYAGLATGK